MMILIDEHTAELSDLCKRHTVEKLYLFGSALTDQFSAKSDIDFLVKFGKIDLGGYFLNFISLKESFEKIFHRKVDLLEEQTVRNPILKHSIDKNKLLIYG